MARRGCLTLVVISLVLLIIGFFFRGPMPHIQLAAERVIKPLGFPLTNTVFAAWITIIVLVTLSYFATRRLEEVPRGLQNFVEAVLEILLGLVETVAGPVRGRRFFPIVATIFLFVLISNWLGLLPGYGTVGLVDTEAKGGFIYQEKDLGAIKLALIPAGGEKFEEEENHSSPQLKEGEIAGAFIPFLRSANTDLNTPLALALMSAIFVEYWGVSTLGLFRYGSKFFNLRTLLKGSLMFGMVDLMVGFLELVSEVARIISFTFRLFGNIFAGEILLAAMGFLMPLVALIPFFGLEIFIGFVQALIFAMLTLVFGVIAVAGHGEEAHAAEAQPAVAPS